jgi:hypothetical protein
LLYAVNFTESLGSPLQSNTFKMEKCLLPVLFGIAVHQSRIYPLLLSVPDPEHYGTVTVTVRYGSDPIKLSVADPDPNPDPPDPRVFGPPGSGSTSQRYGSGSCSGPGSGSFYHHAKIVGKTLIPTI